MYLGYSLPFNGLLEPSTMRPGRRYLNDLPNSYQAQAHQFSIKARQFKVPTGTVTDAQQPQEDFGVLGAEWRTFVSPRWFLKVDTAGAMQGNSRGYMHILAGGGYQYPITKKLSIYSSLAVGGGGGGSVNTGGGLLWDGAVGAQYFLSKHWFADFSVSKLWAASTSFESKGIGIQVGYQLGARNTSDSNSSTSSFDSHPLRIRTVHQQYKKANENWRNRPHQDVGNLGVQVDYFLNPNWYLTGQGLGAHSGDAGAYMTGLIGSGLRTKITKNTFIEVEGLIGAAGGGGLNTGSGLIYQANLGLGYQLSKSLEIQGNLGEAKAANGDFRAHIIGLSLGYKFNALTGR